MEVPFCKNININLVANLINYNLENKIFKVISSIYLNPSTKFRRVRIDIIMYVIVLF